MSFNGSNRIRQNGSTTDTFSCGIRIEHSSVTLNGAKVAGNTGPGILGEQGSALNFLNGSTIQNRSEEGVSLSIQSNAGIFQPITIAGNGASSVTCHASSLTFGDFTRIKNVNCNLQPEVERTETKSRVVLL